MGEETMAHTIEFRWVVLGLLLGFAWLVAGCAPDHPVPVAAPPASVTVSYPVEREVIDHVDFTARTAAVDSVEVRARVWGYLDKVNFKEGALVKKGDVLFEIDPRSYQAAVDQVQALIVQAEAQLRFKESQFNRLEKLFAKGAIPREEFELVQSERDVAAATIGSHKADLRQRQLDLGFTKVVAPISGRVSRMLVTEGNLIQSGQNGGGTLLTTLVSVDPIYAYFDVDEHTVLRVRQLIRDGKVKSARETEWPVSLGLASEEGFPRRGTINFVDNQVNPKTGTLRLRGVFRNSDQTLDPGFFGRVRVPVGQPHEAVLVTDRAIDDDQGQKIVYVVTEKNEVAARPVRTGALHDGLREITEGLKAGERVVVIGLQQVRPGMTAEPKIVQMPGQKAPATHELSERPVPQAVARIGHER
jgi:membrane fusion protein, multidrug efflux system